MNKILIIIGLLIIFSTTYARQNDRKHILKEQYIFPLQGEHVHSSNFVILPNGDLLAVWFQGSGERKADDVRVMGARLKKGSKDWTAPFLMADTPGIPDCNPILFLNHSGKLYLMWIAVQANRWENSIIRYKTSTRYATDGAPEWDWQETLLLKPDDSFAEEVEKKFKDLPENPMAWAEYAPHYDRQIITASKDLLKRSIGWMTRTQPLLLDDSRIVLPLYSDGLNFSLAAISDDDGETWRPSLPIVGRGPIQPALVEKRNGDLVAYMRDSGNPPSRVHRSVSTDRGESWTATTKTDIPNTASVEVLKLENGYWAFLGNDVDDGRYQVSLYLSDDEGESWAWKTQLENVPDRSEGFSYPCIAQDSKGLLHITYSYASKTGQKSIKYLVVNPKKIVR